MKPLIIIVAMLLLPSCGTVPVDVSYSGAAGGHTFKVGYSGKEGVGGVINNRYPGRFDGNDPGGGRAGKELSRAEQADEQQSPDGRR